MKGPYSTVWWGRRRRWYYYIIINYNSMIIIKEQEETRRRHAEKGPSCRYLIRRSPPTPYCIAYRRGYVLLGGVPQEQKMLKGDLPRVIYHQVY